MIVFFEIIKDLPLKFDTITPFNKIGLYNILVVISLTLKNEFLKKLNNKNELNKC
jgi:hypothetical protein